MDAIFKLANSQLGSCMELLLIGSIEAKDHSIWKHIFSDVCGVPTAIASRANPGELVRTLLQAAC